MSVTPVYQRAAYESFCKPTPKTSPQYGSCGLWGGPDQDGQQWPVGWADAALPALAAYRKGMLADEAGCKEIARLMTQAGPIGLCVWGDSEAILWAYPELLALEGIGEDCLRMIAKAAGVGPGDYDFFRESFDVYVNAAPALLVQYRWPYAESIIRAALTAHDIDWAGEVFQRGDQSWSKIDLHCVYRLNEFGCYRQILDGQHVLIVSDRAVEIAGRLASKEYQEAWGMGDFTVSAITAPTYGVSKSQNWPALREKMCRGAWTICLAACGTLSFAVCNLAVELGRKAIDIGMTPKAILGGSHPHVSGFAPVPMPKADGKSFYKCPPTG